MNRGKEDELRTIHVINSLIVNPTTEVATGYDDDPGTNPNMHLEEALLLTGVLLMGAVAVWALWYGISKGRVAPYDPLFSQNT